MNDDQIVGLVFLAPIFILVIAAFLTRNVDRSRVDHVAAYKRRIERNGFKSRIGAK